MGYYGSLHCVSICIISAIFWLLISVSSGRTDPNNHDAKLTNFKIITILTPQHVLFLICLYISSRALSKVFEHRNFVARYRRETKYLRKFRSLVTMDARLAYNICRNFHKHNKLFYLLRQKMIYEHIGSLTFFTWWVSLQVTPFKHFGFTSCFHRVFVDVRKRK